MKRSCTYSLRISAYNYVCPTCRHHLAPAKRRRFATTVPSQSEIYDVVAVGGGPVGLSLLAALKSSPVTSHLRTALIEAQDLSKARQWTLPPDLYSNRASSLTPSSVEFLDEVGAWKHVDQARTQPYVGMQVWDAANDASIQFDWKAEAVKYNAPLRSVATMTENANLTKGLLSRIAELGAEHSLLESTSVTSIKNGEDDIDGLNLSSWPVVSLSSPKSSKITARLLLGADGFNSPVRTFAGIASSGWDHDRHGVVATLTTAPREEAFDHFFSDSPQPAATAYQRFLPSLGGPIALLPLPNDRASLVWSTTTQNAAYLKKLPEASLVALINAAFRLSQTDIKYMFSLPPTPDATSSNLCTHSEELDWRLQHTPSPPPPLRLPPIITSVQPGTVAPFPLRFRHASSYISSRVALLGDAAHTIHPLAGQGLNLGLADAKSLAATIAYAVSHGMDLGDLATLERYNAARWGPNLKMGLGVDGLNRVYQLGGGSETAGPGILGSLISRARGLGMKALGASDTLKTAIMRQAEG